jgi:hypothetical protein
MSSPEDLDPPDPSDPIDRRLREILDAEPGAADRIARRALDAPPRRFWLWRPSAVLPLAAAALLLVLLLLPRPSATPNPAAGAALSITNVGGVIAVRDASGNATIVHVGEPAEAPSGGQIFIAMGEEEK